MTAEGTAARDDRTIRDYAPAPQPPAARAMPLATVLDTATFEVPVDALTGLRADPTTPAEELRRETGRQLDDIHFQLLTCRVDELHPHPSYVRHHLTVPASKLSALAERDDLALREPLVITRDRTIIDGYARWEIARQQGRPTLPCIEYELTEAEALHWLLQRHRRSNGLNDFSRILLALELEHWFREKARSNQRAGGQKKGLSKLTEAERLDVRSEIAAAAGVSVGNVTKVRQLTRTAHQELLQALRSGEISIHRAWLWSKASPEKQREALWLYQTKRGIAKTIRTRISRHRSKSSPTVRNLGDLFRHLSALESSRLGPVSVEVIRAPGKTIFLTEQLFRNLGLQEELAPLCVTNSC
jgi:ParB-like chromosome segregation protein Spo0J